MGSIDEAAAIAVGGTPELSLELILETGKLTQPKQVGRVDLHALEALLVGEQGAGQHQSVPGVVFCSSDGETVTEAVYLLGVDSKDGEATFDKNFHESAPSDLNANGDQSGVACPTHVNYRRHRNPQRAKGADRLWPKGTQPDAPSECLVHTDTKAAGVEVGTKSLVSYKRNKVSPLLRPFGGRRGRKARCRGSG